MFPATGHRAGETCWSGPNASVRVGYHTSDRCYYGDGAIDDTMLERADVVFFLLRVPCRPGSHDFLSSYVTFKTVHVIKTSKNLLTSQYHIKIQKRCFYTTWKTLKTEWKKKKSVMSTYTHSTLPACRGCQKLTVTQCQEEATLSPLDRTWQKKSGMRLSQCRGWLARHWKTYLFFSYRPRFWKSWFQPSSLNSGREEITGEGS